MNLILKRNGFLPLGIFGDLRTETGDLLAVTLEHSYEEHIGADASSETRWRPKLPAGIYTCKRGQHQLHSGPIETFEVTGVPGHSGILIHPGNTEAASEGCILVGDSRKDMTITGSRDAFQRFLNTQEGQDQFLLTVEA